VELHPKVMLCASITRIKTSVTVLVTGCSWPLIAVVNTIKTDNLPN
jgi:hypothetical protein